MNEYFEKVFEYIYEKELKEKQKLNVSLFDAFSIEQYPRKLYKFRCCSKNGLDSLSQEYLWFCNPKEFDDPEDSSILLGPDENTTTAIQNEKRLTATLIQSLADYFEPAFVKSGVSKDSFVRLLQNYANHNISTQEVLLNIQKFIESLPIEQKKEVNLLSEKSISSITQKFELLADSARMSIVNNYRTNQKVCCLTETFDNKKMWEDYSAKYSGFVIQYDVHLIAASLAGINDLLLYLFPIDYTDAKTNIDLSPVLCDIFTGDTVPIGDESKNTLKKSFAQSLIKNESYNSEKEWRFVFPKDIESKVSFPYASAVYAGYKIKPHNYSRLKNLCKKKRIPLYKQVYSEQTASLTYQEDIS